MKKYCILFILVPLFSMAQIEDEQLRLFHSISSHDLLDYATELSNDKYLGRLSGSPEYMMAASWVAGQLKESGVEPFGDNGSYFQYFDNPYTKVHTLGTLLLVDSLGNPLQSYSFPNEYFPAANSASGSVMGEVVYVGFGISAPELDYDDYKNIDVQGKIVIVEGSHPFEKTIYELSEWVHYSEWKYKLKNAKEHGAIGLLFINHLLGNPNTIYQEDFVYAHIGDTVLNDLFSNMDIDYKQIKSTMIENVEPASFSTGKFIRIEAETEHFPETQSCNVIGLIRGSNPQLSEEVIIFGAHLDGVGYVGEVLPGALDNASGSADILAAAKALGESSVKPEVSIMFIFLGGEECGLLGSRHYCQNPKVPLEKTRYFFNLDMVGNAMGLTLSGVDTYPETKEVLTGVNTKYIHRSIKTSGVWKSRGRPRSDGQVFEMAGVKTIHFWTHDQVYPVYYHHPLDKPNVLTPELMEDAAKLIFLSAFEWH